MLKNKLSQENYKNVVNICSASQGAIATGSSKFKWIDEILEGSVNARKENIALSKLDKMYLSKVWGKPAVVLTVLLGLILSFIPALPFMGVGEAIGALKAPVAAALIQAGAPEVLIQIICTVVIQSFSYIVKMLGFVFGVTLVFGLLEEVGVMARISYVFDNTMGKLGLQGKSVMPCVVALVATFQETYSVKWTARIALYYTFTALLLAAIAYRVGLLIF